MYNMKITMSSLSVLDHACTEMQNKSIPFKLPTPHNTSIKRDFN